MFERMRRIFPDVFDPADPRKGAASVIQEKERDKAPEDEHPPRLNRRARRYKKLAQTTRPRLSRRLLSEWTDRTRNSSKRNGSENSREKNPGGNASDLASPKNVRQKEVSVALANSPGTKWDCVRYG